MPSKKQSVVYFSLCHVRDAIYTYAVRKAQGDDNAGPRIIVRSSMTCLLRTNSSAFLQRLCIALWFLVLSALAGIAAYYWMFTGFSVWDDEGTLLLTVRQFLGGMKLYDQIKGYGPVYYFYNWILRAASGTPTTHDIVRMSSLIPWLLTALVCAWIVLRLTRSLLLASFTHLLTFLARRGVRQTATQ